MNRNTEDALFDKLEKQFVKHNNMNFERQFNENVMAPPSSPVYRSPMKRKLDEVDDEMEYPGEKKVKTSK
jgi:hypothetical protein